MHKRWRLDGQTALITGASAGIGLWEWACNDQPGEPDIVLASAGDVPTLEMLAAIDMLRTLTQVYAAYEEACARAGLVDFAELLLRALDVSDVRMDQGSLRCDANVSLAPRGSDVFVVADPTAPPAIRASPCTGPTGARSSSTGCGRSTPTWARSSRSWSSPTRRSSAGA